MGMIWLTRNHKETFRKNQLNLGIISGKYAAAAPLYLSYFSFEIQLREKPFYIFYGGTTAVRTYCLPIRIYRKKKKYTFWNIL